MSYTFLRVEAENFMGFRHLDLDLSRYHGLTLVAGERSGAGASNGASKSTVFEAIHWCLWGRLIRKQRRADKVMHRWMRPEERTLARVTVSVDGREVVVERGRTRSGATLRIHEGGRPNSAATIDGVQARITSILGKDARTFGFTDMFSGATAQFCQLTDAERKAVLESMTGADRYHAASELAGKRLTEVQSRQLATAERTTQLEARVQQAVEQRQIEVGRCLADHRQQQLEERRLRREAAAASSAAFQASGALADHHRERNQAAEAQAGTRDRLQRAARAAEAQERAALATVSEADQAGAVIRSQTRALEDELRRLRSEERPDKCPRCGQAWPDQGAGQEHIAQEVARLNKRMAALRDEAAPHAARRAQAAAEAGDAARARQVSMAAIQELDQATDTSRFRTLLSASIAARTTLEHAMQAISDHLSALPEDGGLAVDTEAIDATITDLRRRLADTRGEAADAEHEVRRLSFWRRGFGRGGLPSMLLDSSVPQMNEAVARIASALSYGELSVSFDPAAAKGRGDVFAVNVTYADGADDYDMSSSGEHARVDIAVLFALRDLVERRGSNSCTQLFLDEVFQSTDAAFADAAVAMLRQNYAGKDIFLISHEDTIKAQCDNTIVVRKTGREAQVARG